MPEKQDVFTIQFESGTKTVQRLRAAIPREDLPMAALIPQFHRLFDIIISIELADQAVTCRSGCSACCRQLVPISLPEAFFMQDVVGSLLPKRRKQVRRGFVSIVQRTRDVDLLLRMKHPRENTSVDVDYFNLNLVCPFLESHRCGIYKERPLACREYHVASDKQYCSDPNGNQIKRVKVKRNVAAMLAVFASRLYGIPKDPIPLFLSLDVSEEKRKLVEKRWSGTWMFQCIVHGLMRLNDDTLHISMEKDAGGRENP